MKKRTESSFMYCALCAVVLAFVFPQKGYAQKKPKKNEAAAHTSNMTQEMYILSTRSGDVAKQEKFIKEKRKKQTKMSIADSRNKFVEQRRKEREMIQKDLKKPQYSNPMYFGHKRPPKKRPIGKQKLCKECGMYH